MCSEEQIRTIIKKEIAPLFGRQEVFEEKAEKSILHTAGDIKELKEAVGKISSYSFDAKSSTEATKVHIDNLLEKFDFILTHHEALAGEVSTLKLAVANFKGKIAGIAIAVTIFWAIIVTALTAAYKYLTNGG